LGGKKQASTKNVGDEKVELPTMLTLNKKSTKSTGDSKISTTNKVSTHDSENSSKKFKSSEGSKSSKDNLEVEERTLSKMETSKKIQDKIDIEEGPMIRMGTTSKSNKSGQDKNSSNGTGSKWEKSTKLQPKTLSKEKGGYTKTSSQLDDDAEELSI
jgi:hypothetical protein